MTMLWVLLTLLLEAFFSGMETGVYCLNRIRLRFRAERGDADAKRVSRLIRNPQALVCTTLAGTNLSVYVSTAICTAFMVSRVGERYAELAATILLAPILLVFAEAVPKSLFQAHPNRLVYALSWPLKMAYWGLLPLSATLRAVTFVSTRLAGEPTTRRWELSEQRLHYFFSESAREGVLSPQQNVMARNIMKLSGVRVRQVLIPLEDVVMVPLEGTFDDLRYAAMQHPHTRLVVYEGERERIAGAVNLIDVLCAEEEAAVAQMVRPLTRIPADLPIDEALVELQKARQVMGVVEDAEEKALGIVTVKDLVEGVVGELHEW